MKPFKRDRTLTCNTCEWNGKFADGTPGHSCELRPRHKEMPRVHTCAQHSINIEQHALWISAKRDEESVDAYAKGELAGRDTASTALEMCGKKCKDLESQLSKTEVNGGNSR